MSLAAATAALMLLAAAPAARAADVALYAPASGFWLEPSDHTGRLYGASGPQANWHVGQWDIPQDLPAFAPDGRSANRWAHIAFLGDGRYEMGQDGNGLPCEKLFPSGRRQVDEFDLFASPNNRQNHDVPSAGGNAVLRLSELAGIRAAVTLHIHGVHPLDAACPTTQVGFIYALTITNPSHKQTLFYQIRLALFQFKPGRAIENAAAPGWFFTGKNTQEGAPNTFGFGDNATTLGAAFARIGTVQSFVLDPLPRLRELIAQGRRFGMDQDLSHWVLSGHYHGQNTFGHVVSDAVYSGFALSGTTK